MLSKVRKKGFLRKGDNPFLVRVMGKGGKLIFCPIAGIKSQQAKYF